MQPEDIGRIVSASDPKISPDGSTVAYVVSRVDLEANKYRSAIWLAAADGSSAPYQFTSGEHGDSGPEWAPDGRRLAFTSRRSEDKDGKRKGTLHVAPVSIPGEVVTLAERDEGFGELAWSPDGTRLTFTSREKLVEEEDERKRPPRKIDRLFSRLDSVGWTIDRPNRIWIVPVDGSAPPRALTGGPYEATSATWSPDGTRIAFVSARHEDFDLDEENDLFILEVDAPAGDDGELPEPTRLTSTDRSWSDPSWSPDGDRIAALTFDTQDAALFGDVAVVDVATGEHTILTEDLDRTCTPFPGARAPVWAGDDLLFSVEDHGAVHVYRVPVAGGTTEVVVGGDRVIEQFDVVDGTIACSASTPTRVAEVFVRSADGDERRHQRRRRQLPRRRPGRAGRALRGAVRRRRRHDRRLDRRAGGRGPVRSARRRSRRCSACTADRCRSTPSTGSTSSSCGPPRASRSCTATRVARPGRPHDWARAIRSPLAKVRPGSGWGGVDYEDVMSVLDAALERYPALDPDRVGILGGSYGGYMTSWAIGHTDRFAAACSERACNNLLTLETSSDASGFFRFVMGVDHLDHPEEYLRTSPITYVKDITTPVLILHSENDLRCNIEQADQLFVALRMLGREQEYHRFPAESHELSRSGSPRHRVQRAELILDFFRRKLQGATEDDSRRTLDGMSFPQRRLRRLRRTPALRRLVAETRLGVDDLVAPAVRARGHQRPAPDQLAPRRRAAHA